MREVLTLTIVVFVAVALAIPAGGMLTDRALQRRPLAAGGVASVISRPGTAPLPARSARLGSG